ncbi:MAG TPA: helix-turn-helix domain-containing protein, partial [Pseudonocardiaceae bacterium]|nr:helix-turn-helix domain-containing protein [Pseudonocardiaceae bacterium]
MTEAPLPVRAVDDVETLKALSDPTRVAILRALMDGSPTRPAVMSVKELAERLGEPQTKLYRHVKQLADRGLIRVAETRIVSGIVEQRYQSGQVSLEFEPGFLGRHAP